MESTSVQKFATCNRIFYFSNTRFKYNSDRQNAMKGKWKGKDIVD